MAKYQLESDTLEYVMSYNILICDLDEVELMKEKNSAK